MKNLLPGLFTLLFLVLPAPLYGQNVQDREGFRDREFIEEEVFDLEIVDIEKEIRETGRLQWGRFFLHPVAGTSWNYTTNVNEGLIDDPVTGNLVRKKQSDNYFIFSPGLAITRGDDYFPLSVGYRGEFIFFDRFDEFNTFKHSVFILHQIKQEYWSMYFDLLYQRLDQKDSNVAVSSGSEQTGQTTDVVSYEALRFKTGIEVDVAPFSIFRDNQALLEFTHYDELARGLNSWYTQLIAGFKTALSEFHKVNLQAGWQTRQYAARRGTAPREFEDFIGAVGQLKFEWLLLPSATLTFLVKGEVQNDTYAASGHKYIDSYAVQYEHRLSQFFGFVVGYELEVERFGRDNLTDARLPSTQRRDQRHSGSLSMIYQARTWATASLGYTYTFLESNVNAFDTEIHLVVFRIEVGF